MITIITENSTYQVDEEHGRFRRIRGGNPPTRNFEADSMWHGGKAIPMGEAYLFVFDDRTKGSTWSSRVTDVLEPLS